MPEKKFGMIEILKGVFKGKKNCGDDIVCQAERIIAEYISRRRNEIIDKYSKRRNRLLNLSLLLIGSAICYFVYRLLI